MDVRVVDAPPRWANHQFAMVRELEVGKALFIAWDELDRYHDGEHLVRVYASMWSRRLNRKFGARKGPAGMYLVRHD